MQLTSYNYNSRTTEFIVNNREVSNVLTGSCSCWLSFLDVDVDEPTD